MNNAKEYNEDEKLIGASARVAYKKADAGSGKQIHRKINCILMQLKGAIKTKHVKIYYKMVEI